MPPPKKTVVLVIQKPRYDLPPALNREIGRIIVRWAYYEQYIQKIIWAISFNGHDKGAALGRMAIRETKPDEQLGLLEWVAEIQSVKLNTDLLKSMKVQVKALNPKRNLVAHGLWAERGTEWLAQETRGSWEEFKGGPRGSKKIQPEAIPTTPNDLRQIWRGIENLIADAKTLKGSIGEA